MHNALASVLGLLVAFASSWVAAEWMEVGVIREVFPPSALSRFPVCPPRIFARQPCTNHPLACGCSANETPGRLLARSGRRHKVESSSDSLWLSSPNKKTSAVGNASWNARRTCSCYLQRVMTDTLVWAYAIRENICPPPPPPFWVPSLLVVPVTSGPVDETYRRVKRHR